MFIALATLLTFGLVTFVVLNQNKLELSIDLAETKGTVTKTSLTTAIRGTLAHLEQGTVNDVYYGVGTFGLAASKTKIRRQLRALRNTGKVALNNVTEGRRSFSLAA